MGKGPSRTGISDEVRSEQAGRRTSFKEVRSNKSEIRLVRRFEVRSCDARRIRVFARQLLHFGRIIT